jgi:hypothetical protein
MRIEQHFTANKLDLYRELAIMKLTKKEAEIAGDTAAASEIGMLVAKQDKVIESATVKGSK